MGEESTIGDWIRCHNEAGDITVYIRDKPDSRENLVEYGDLRMVFSLGMSSQCKVASQVLGVSR